MWPAWKANRCQRGGLSEEVKNKGVHTLVAREPQGTQFGERVKRFISRKRAELSRGRSPETGGGGFGCVLCWGFGVFVWGRAASKGFEARTEGSFAWISVAEAP